MLFHHAYGQCLLAILAYDLNLMRFIWTLFMEKSMNS